MENRTRNLPASSAMP